jgi:hypothetical protein
MSKESVLEQISLVTRNYGDAPAFEQVLLDWFDFLGGKPGEVVVIDAGSDRATHAIYWDLFQRGLIDKLQVIRTEHDDHDFERGYIQLQTAASIASKPYLLWFSIDTLPYRQGHEGWLEEAMGYLDRDDVCTVGGSYNIPAKSCDAWDGWYYSKKCSLNFALMRRTTYMKAIYELAGDYIASGFTTENPCASYNQSRYLPEVAMERYIENHNTNALFKVEDPNWTVFHTNVHEEKLAATRIRYRQRDNILAYMNAGNSTEAFTGTNILYYGQPQPQKLSFLKQIQVMFGKSPLGEHWRNFKQGLGVKQGARA